MNVPASNLRQTSFTVGPQQRLNASRRHHSTEQLLASGKQGRDDVPRF